MQSNPRLLANLLVILVKILVDLLVFVLILLVKFANSLGLVG